MQNIQTRLNPEITVLLLKIYFSWESKNVEQEKKS